MEMMPLLACYSPPGAAVDGWDPFGLLLMRPKAITQTVMIHICLICALCYS